MASVLVLESQNMRVLFLLLLLVNSSIAISNDTSADWRTPELDDVVYLQTDKGLVIIELAPFMAPNHVSQFIRLVRSGFYDGLDFYRVIDGFVAQGGDVNERKTSFDIKPLKAEFTRTIPDKSDFLLVQQNDFIAPQTGYLNGFVSGRDLTTKEEWLLHCPGNVAMARSNEKDSATSDFYIVMGQAPRHLDRNMSSFGRVIYGLDVVQAFQRANINSASGVIEDKTQRTKIQWIKMATDIEPSNRIMLQIQQQTSTQVSERLESARKMDNPFYHFQGNGNLDLCYYPLKTRTL